MTFKKTIIRVENAFLQQASTGIYTIYYLFNKKPPLGLIDALNGTISFESTEGKGTKFIIKLPML